MAVDNFDIIKPLLNWKNDDQFYFLQIIQRKKDHKKGKVNGTNNNARVVKYYLVPSMEYLDFITPEVKGLCNLFNARAGIVLNQRSYRMCALKVMTHIPKQIINESFNKVNGAYAHIVGKEQNPKGDKYWLIDIDDQKEPNHYTDGMIDYMNQDCRPEGENKFVTYLPSKSGFHIITKPFDSDHFMKKYPEAYIMKNSPTNLYIP
jgi:hypothetical protein